MSSPPSSLMDKRTLAERLGTTERHVKRLIEHRRIPFIKLGDGRNAPVRFDPKAIDAWLRNHTVSVGEFPP